jgi:hypothetical protein
MAALSAAGNIDHDKSGIIFNVSFSALTLHNLPMDFCSDITIATLQQQIIAYYFINLI